MKRLLDLFRKQTPAEPPPPRQPDFFVFIATPSFRTTICRAYSRT